MYSQHRIGVVVPAYNEENLIRDVLSTIPDYVDAIYVVDDGSKDGTGDIIREFLSDSRYVYVEHITNGGVGTAISTGYYLAVRDSMDVVAVLAGDNQMDPKYLPYLLDPIIWKKADYTKGNRLVSSDLRKGMSMWRTLGNGILTVATKISTGYYDMIDPQNGYTAISCRALKRIDMNGIYPLYGYCNDMLGKMNVVGCKIMDVVIPARYGNEKSKIKYIPYIAKVSWLLLKIFIWRLYTKYLLFDFHPVIFFYIGGFIFMLLGIGGMLYSVYEKVVFNIPLFVNLALSLLIGVVGFQFLIFAVIYDIQLKNNNKEQNGVKVLT
jgi:glycosyltransferase involved in cell wall biosynthesis